MTVGTVSIIICMCICLKLESLSFTSKLNRYEDEKPMSGAWTEVLPTRLVTNRCLECSPGLNVLSDQEPGHHGPDRDAGVCNILSHPFFRSS